MKNVSINQLIIIGAMFGATGVFVVVCFTRSGQECYQAVQTFCALIHH
jgi:hypothetical protein